MWTRNALDLAGRFPRIAQALARIVVGDAVIDGEVCVLDPQGVPRFELIQQGRTEEAVLFAFDLLRLDGEDLRARPLEERLDLLRSVLSNAPPQVQLAEEVPGDVASALAKVRERGLEGLILKARGSVYEKGRSREWLKLKAQATQELAIVGWTPGKGNARGSLGALLLAVADGKGGYEFAGKVGTGFSSKQRAELQKQLAQDERPDPPARGAPRLRDAHWVEPRLVAQVRFTEWTSDGKLRHPAFQGIRADKKPEECLREKPAPVPTATPAKGRARKQTPAPEPDQPQKLTNPDRLLYPKDRITKADVAAYYDAVAPALLNALRDRTLTLVHWNQGIEKPSWFQQEVGAAHPAPAGQGAHLRGRGIVRAAGGRDRGEAAEERHAGAVTSGAPRPSLLRLHAERVRKDGGRALFAARGRGRPCLHSLALERGEARARSAAAEFEDDVAAAAGDGRSFCSSVDARGAPAALQAVIVSVGAAPRARPSPARLRKAVRVALLQ